MRKEVRLLIMFRCHWVTIVVKRSVWLGRGQIICCFSYYFLQYSEFISHYLCKHEIHSILSGNQYKITLRLLRGVTFNDAEHVCVTCCNGFKSNHLYCHITTARVSWWVKFLRACSRQCRNNLHIDSTYLYRRQCAEYIYSVHTVHY